ncbi:hypothetical protein SFC66_06495 [Terribacillus saccharophilus]|uniref:hypothetical protein n=1 Tax=Terribacillus saccharophilus TaxID=361277 RepID=UPI00398249B3
MHKTYRVTLLFSLFFQLFSCEQPINPADLTKEEQEIMDEARSYNHSELVDGEVEPGTPVTAVGEARYADEYEEDGETMKKGTTFQLVSLYGSDSYTIIHDADQEIQFGTTQTIYGIYEGYDEMESKPIIRAVVADLREDEPVITREESSLIGFEYGNFKRLGGYFDENDRSAIENQTAFQYDFRLSLVEMYIDEDYRDKFNDQETATAISISVSGENNSNYTVDFPAAFHVTTNTGEQYDHSDAVHSYNAAGQYEPGETKAASYYFVLDDKAEIPDSLSITFEAPLRDGKKLGSDQTATFRYAEDEE